MQYKKLKKTKIMDRLNNRVCGAMDNASDYESGDCRFDPCQTRLFLHRN